MESVLLRSSSSAACSLAARPRSSSAVAKATTTRTSNHTHRSSSSSIAPARIVVPAIDQTNHGIITRRLHSSSTALARAAANEATEATPAAPAPAADAAASNDAGAAPAAPAAPSTSSNANNAEVAADRRKGVKTVLAELKGLDMPPGQVLKYAQGAVRLPKRAPLAADGVPVVRAAEALAQIMAASDDVVALPQSADAACNDPRALAALNHLLTDLWRWKRRGGGSRWEEDDQATSPSAVALLELQGVDVGGRAAAAEAAANDEGPGFFDAGNLNEREKQELAGMMRGAAMAGVQNAFWGSLVLSGLVLLLLNFARG